MHALREIVETLEALVVAFGPPRLPVERPELSNRRSIGDDEEANPLCVKGVIAGFWGASV
jgi:hypothetical protein